MQKINADWQKSVSKSWIKKIRKIHSQLFSRRERERGVPFTDDDFINYFSGFASPGESKLSPRFSLGIW
jgi:hypothetical protein